MRELQQQQQQQQQSDKRTDEKFETKRKFVVDAMRVALNITLNQVDFACSSDSVCVCKCVRWCLCVCFLFKDSFIFFFHKFLVLLFVE